MTKFCAVTTTKTPTSRAANLIQMHYNQLDASTHKYQHEVMHKHISDALIGKIRSLSENGIGNASYGLRQLFLTRSTRSVDRFQGVPEFAWEKDYNFIFTNL
jgi:hypothetical protein